MSIRIIVLVALALFTDLSQAQTLSCEQRCIQRDQECQEEAKGVYITCGQQGGTQEACEKKKRDYLASCGCTRCSKITPDTIRTGLMKTWYCECGEPYDDEEGGGDTLCEADGNGGYVGDCNPDYESPILIDVAGNGFRLTDPTSGVRFDIRASGIPLQIAWTAPDTDDAWLALDRNSNGLIDDGRELFGNHAAQPVSANPNGFIALAEFDSNLDGLMTPADTVFHDLRLWRDRNHNGVSESHELTSLASAGIYQISLSYASAWRRDQYGNLFRYRAKVNGSKFAYDVYLRHR